MLRHLHQKIRGTLSRYELDVFYLWLENYSTKEIAQKLGKGEKSVANAISRSLGKLRVALQ
ncbi:MAG: helix-turn-helix transcriptional regulator [Clostridia bacterium]|nr:helix-turn-helix transcriptional regulator [Clostridia bacterium]